LDYSIEKLSLPELHNHAVLEFRGGGGTRPGVLLIDYNGRQAVLKDHNQCDLWFGRVVGPLLAWRESRALIRLHDLAGVLSLISRPDRCSILMEHIDGIQVVRSDIDKGWTDFFEDLSGLIGEMHALGVAHCDLRSPTNVLITNDMKPALVDFVASFGRGARINFVAALLFRQFVRVDFSAVTKLKRYLAPELLAAGEAENEQVGGRAGQFFRWLGSKARDASRAVFANGNTPKE
jgi:serine/threonine protein kinase